MTYKTFQLSFQAPNKEEKTPIVLDPINKLSSLYLMSWSGPCEGWFEQKCLSY